MMQNIANILYMKKNTRENTQTKKTKTSLLYHRPTLAPHEFPLMLLQFIESPSLQMPGVIE